MGENGGRKGTEHESGSGSDTERTRNAGRPEQGVAGPGPFRDLLDAANVGFPDDDCIRQTRYKAAHDAALAYARACGWFPPEAVERVRGAQVDADGRPRSLDRHYLRDVEGESMRRGARVAELEAALREVLRLVDQDDSPTLDGHAIDRARAVLK